MYMYMYTHIHVCIYIYIGFKTKIEDIGLRTQDVNRTDVGAFCGQLGRRVDRSFPV